MNTQNTSKELLVTINDSILVDTNLSNMSLDGAQFINKDLTGINFSNSSLKNCNFENCNLANIDFSGADLTNCLFPHSSIQGSDFSNAKLRLAEFYKTQITDNKFVRSDFNMAKVTKCTVKDNLFLATNWLAATWNKSDFSGENLQGNLLHKAHIINCQLRNTNFEDAKLIGATLEENDTLDASFSRASLTLAHFNKQIFCRTNFQGACFVSGWFKDSLFDECNLNQADLSVSTRINLNINNCSTENMISVCQKGYTFMLPVIPYLKDSKGADYKRIALPLSNLNTDTITEAANAYEQQYEMILPLLNDYAFMIFSANRFAGFFTTRLNELLKRPLHLQNATLLTLDDSCDKQVTAIVDVTELPSIEECQAAMDNHPNKDSFDVKEALQLALVLSYGVLSVDAQRLIRTPYKDWNTKDIEALFMVLLQMVSPSDDSENPTEAIHEFYDQFYDSFNDEIRYELEDRQLPQYDDSVF